MALTWGSQSRSHAKHCTKRSYSELSPNAESPKRKRFSAWMPPTSLSPPLSLQASSHTGILPGEARIDSPYHAPNAALLSGPATPSAGLLQNFRDRDLSGRAGSLPYQEASANKVGFCFECIISISSSYASLSTVSIYLSIYLSIYQMPRRFNPGLQVPRVTNASLRSGARGRHFGVATWRFAILRQVRE